MNPFIAPRTDYTNFYDTARFNLTWKMNIFMFLANIPFVITAVFFPLEVFLSVLFGWLVPFVYLIILYTTRKYKVLAAVYVALGTISTGLLMNFVATDFHVVELTYMVMIALYAFITLGKTAGILSSAGHCCWVIFYFAFTINHDILRSEVMDNTQLIWGSAQFLLAFSMVGFLILEFVNMNRYAEEKYMRSNHELQRTVSGSDLRDREKTVMLQEIHHRVKNNLQVVTSLLRLQSHEIRDERAQEQFDDAISRVIAMSMIHEKMYQTQDFSSLNLEEYLTALSSDLIDSYAVQKPVNVVVESSLNRVSNKSVVPLSLLFNELISNSLKHAFINSEKGEIKIKIKQSADKVEVRYSDNGVWVEKKSGPSFGTELIEILTDQMAGELIRKSNENGTVYVIRLGNLG
jgi:two-component system, sensor histidine kinase PdtaS